MIPWNLLGRTTTPGGDELALMHQPGEFLILAGGKPLMSSRMHGSEEAMAEMACAPARDARRPRRCWSAASAWASRCGPRSTSLPAGATVVVAELVAGSWSGIAGLWDIWPTIRCEDRRVQVEVTPVDQLLQGHQGAVRRRAARRRQRPLRIHDRRQRLALHRLGLAATQRALTDGGTLAVWSAQEDRRFEQRLRHAGFAVTVERVRARLKKGGPHHVILRAAGGAEAPPPGTRCMRYERAADT